MLYFQKTEKMILAGGTPQGRVLKVLGSMEDRKVPEEIIKATLARFGRIDVLVCYGKGKFTLLWPKQINNAGSAAKPGAEDVLGLDNLDFLYNVNFRRSSHLWQFAHIPKL